MRLIGIGRAIAFGGAECFRRTCRPTLLPLDRQIRRLGLPEVWIWRSRLSGWAKCDRQIRRLGLPEVWTWRSRLSGWAKCDCQIRRLGLPEVWIWRSRLSGWAKCDCPIGIGVCGLYHELVNAALARH